METKIISFKLPMLNDLETVNIICAAGYQKTGNKFTVRFNGSKGYLSNVVVSAEGTQEPYQNILWIEKLKTKKGNLRSTIVHIYYSEKKGVRIYNSIQDQKELAVEKITWRKRVHHGLNDDLPF